MATGADMTDKGAETGVCLYHTDFERGRCCEYE